VSGTPRLSRQANVAPETIIQMRLSQLDDGLATPMQRLGECSEHLPRAVLVDHVIQCESDAVRTNSLLFHNVTLCTGPTMDGPVPC
jgi:hypothetical protein